MKLVLKYGLILGLALCICIAISHLLGFNTTNMRSAVYGDLGTTIVTMVIVFLAIRAERRRRGSLTILQGICTGLLVFLISYPITAAFLWFYQHYINPDWLGYVVAYEQSKLAQAGESAAVISDRISSVRARSTGLAQVVTGLIGTVGFGLVLSLIFSLVLRKRPGPSVQRTYDWKSAVKQE